jgi:myo-inositol-1(or 4)-monophosphatase
MQYAEELKLAESAARLAGKLLMELWPKEITILSREGHDIKLQADQDAEKVILERLSQSGYPVLAEESGEHNLEDPDKLFWIVDPLDGSMNFSRGLPLCCVSIALGRHDKIALGVIYDFSRDECFSGIPGEGAWLNGQPMHIAQEKNPAQAILCTGFPGKRLMSDNNLHGFMNEARRFKKVRLLGTAALMLAYVACGRVDAYAEDDIMLWDVAAGIALVQAAGGFIYQAPSECDTWARSVRCSSHAELWPAYADTPKKS